MFPVQPSFSPKLLAVSFSYPPANNPRAIQVARLLRYLDLPSILVCADYEDKNDRRDELLTSDTEGFLQKLIRVPFSPSVLRRIASGIVGRVGRPIWDEWPDEARGWKNAVVASVADYFRLSGDPPDILVTFGTPMSDHLIGRELKRRYEIPWMAHFSDPWADNPFKNYNWLTLRANLSLERRVVEAADRLLFTSEEMVALVMSKYPASLLAKTRIVPHSYESTHTPQVPSTVNSEITIRFLGDMYGPRTPRPLFAALADILNENAETFHRVRFEFIGSMCDLNLSQMGLDALPAGLVVVRETVTNQESLSLMRSSDGLLVIDAPAVMSVFLPSKLVDYIGAGKPILGITPPGTASRLVAELGGWIGNPADPVSVREAIKLFVRFLRERRAGGDQPWGNEEVRKRYEAPVVASNFRDLVSEFVDFDSMKMSELAAASRPDLVTRQIPEPKS